MQVIRRFAMRPLSGVRLTVIAREANTPYSGMLPGYIAGDYGKDEIHIDLSRLCAFAQARFIHAEASAIDTSTRQVKLFERPSVRYDYLSINTGGEPRVPKDLSRRAIRVKPLSTFLPAWERILAETAGSSGVRLGIIGGGPGTVELAIAISERYGEQFQIEIISASDNLLAKSSKRCQSTIENRLIGRTRTRLNFEVDSNTDNGSEVQVSSVSGDQLAYDYILSVTDVMPSDRFDTGDLAVDEAGFIRVNRFLQSISHAEVFGAGDVVELDNQPRPKSGVYSVRAGPYLAHNLAAAILAKRLRPFRAQQHALALLRTSPNSALAVRKHYLGHGRYWGLLKRVIDKRFMRKFNDPEPMEEDEYQYPPSLQSNAPERMRCGGCGAKLGADLLTQVLRRLDVKIDERNPVNIGDDAAVVDYLTSTIATSCDGFRTMISDPWVFGKITANHAINDLYAMGATPKTALALATVPIMAQDLMEEDLFQMSSGALVVFNDAGVQLVGGHSAEGLELSLAFTVSGVVGNRYLTKSGLEPQEILICTKPLGTGVILAGLAQSLVGSDTRSRAIQIMTQSNAPAADIFLEHGSKACTDVTGFGFLGHLSEMLRASEVTAKLDISKFRFLPGAAEAVDRQIQSSLYVNNVQSLQDWVVEGEMTQSKYVDLLIDPQTSGGLLAGVPADQADDCLAYLIRAGYDQAFICGSVFGPQEQNLIY